VAGALHCPGAPLTAHFPLRLTALDSSAYSPFRDPTPPSDRPDRIGVFETEAPADSSRTGSGSWQGNFGDRLKRERELREVSIEELTKATRISARFVEALENEDWAAARRRLWPRVRAHHRTLSRPQ